MSKQGECDYCNGTGTVRIERDGSDPGGCVPCSHCRPSDCGCKYRPTCSGLPLVALGPDSTERLRQLREAGLRAGQYITDGTKTLDADGLRRIWECLAVLESECGKCEAIDDIRATLPDFEKV